MIVLRKVEMVSSVWFLFGGRKKGGSSSYAEGTGGSGFVSQTDHIKYSETIELNVRNCYLKIVFLHEK